MTYPGDTPREDPRQFDSGRDAWLLEKLANEKSQTNLPLKVGESTGRSPREVQGPPVSLLKLFCL